MKTASNLALRERLHRIADEQCLDLSRPDHARAAAHSVCASLRGRRSRGTVDEAARVLRHVLPTAFQRAAH